MQSQKDVKRKIKTISSIQKVTKAMESIANIRLQKVIKVLYAMRPYAEDLSRFIFEVFVLSGKDRLKEIVPYFRKERTTKVLFVVLSADRGLCGMYNSRLISVVSDAARFEVLKGRKLKLITVGKKAADYFSRRHYEMVGNYPSVSLEDVPEFSKKLVGQCARIFEERKADEIYVFYTHFISMGKQEVYALKLLPVEMESGEEHNIPIRAGALFEEDDDLEYRLPEFICEPSERSLLPEIFLHYFEISMRQMMLETIVSEHASRMIAMQQSTSSADDMIKGLTMQYNKIRQSLITRELTEIINSVEALN